MYAKVFASLWEGTLYGKTDAQLVFIFLLARCNADGNVTAVPEAIAGPTGMPMERVMAALDILEGPDENSGSPEEDGKRLIRIGKSWRWHVVNYKKYRALRDADQMRAQSNERVRRFRERNAVTDVTLGNARKRQEEVEVEEDGSSFGRTPAAIVQSLSTKTSLTKPKPRGVDSVRVARRLETMGKADQKRFFALAGWFWNSGTHDNDLVMHLLEDAIQSKPENWYAYYAKDGPARLNIEAKFRESRESALKEARNAEDRRFFAHA